MSGTAAPRNRILAAGAMAGVFFTLGAGVGPTAFAETPDAGPTPVSTPSSPAVPGDGLPSHALSSEGLSDAGLTEAVLRGLGMSLAEFNASGELGRQAIQALDSLRGVPGYAGISLGNGKIQVQGTGPALQVRVEELNKSGGAEFVLVAPPAPATPTPEPQTPSTVPQQPQGSSTAEAPQSREIAVSAEQLFQAYLRDVGTAGLQAVVSEAGKFVIRTGGVAAAQSAPDGRATATATATATPTNVSGTAGAGASPGKITPAEFVSRYANVVLDGAAPLKPEAEVPGGVGYRSDTGFTCSTGFSAFDPAGLPAVLTAGHCAEDGTATTVDLLLGGVPAGRLGSFQFSQFGGPGNTPVLNPNSPTPGNVGTDIAVIGAIRQDLDPLPATSTYESPSQPAPDVKIIGTAPPVVGMPVCRSGWRTGWSCGHISAVGIFLVGGPTYVDDPTDPRHNDIRAFNGFLSYDVQSAGGDSGGPWISGNFAVGTHSAGESGGAQNIAVAATLQDSLKVLPGYQLELFLNKPALAAPAGKTFKAGTSITGRVPAAPASAVAAGSQVRITYTGQQPFEVPVDAGGNWSFTAPEAPGPFTFEAETVNGLSRSGAVPMSINISPSFLPAPTVTAAAGPVPALETVEGTGTPGATVNLAGDVAGSALVGADGRWSVSLPAQAPYGSVDVTAIQSYPGLPDSPAASATFALMPPPPAVSSLSEGQHLMQDALPATVSGTGVDGADVRVSIDGTPVEGTVAAGAARARSVGNALSPLVLVAGGGWAAPFPPGLAVGSHTMLVTQAVDGVDSAPARVTFSVDAPPAAAPAALAGTAGNAGLPAAAGLAYTGSSALVPAAIAAVAAILAGAVLTVVVRRRERSAR